MQEYHWKFQSSKTHKYSITFAGIVEKMSDSSRGNNEKESSLNFKIFE